MIRKRWQARLPVCAVLMGTLVQFTTCQMSPDQMGRTPAALQALLDTARTFVEELAREVLAAAVT